MRNTEYSNKVGKSARPIYKDLVNVSIYLIESNNDEAYPSLPSHFSNELIIFSSKEAYEEASEISKIEQSNDIIIAKRVIGYEYVDLLATLPTDEKILMVNDTQRSAEEAIEMLIELDFDDLNLIPYYPGSDLNIEGISYGISPGEVDKIPESIKHKYDLGSRTLDILTVMQILNKLGVEEEKASTYFSGYVNKILHSSKEIIRQNEIIINQSKENRALYEKTLLLNKNLEEKVKQRTEKLSNALQELKKTQEDMVEMRKMASLAGLVSGIAHEMGTPLGNSLTSITYLARANQEFVHSFQDNKISRSELQKHLDSIGILATSITGHLNKSILLLNQFKLLSPDAYPTISREIFDRCIS